MFDIHCFDINDRKTEEPAFKLLVSSDKVELKSLEFGNFAEIRIKAVNGIAHIYVYRRQRTKRGSTMAELPVIRIPFDPPCECVFMRKGGSFDVVDPTDCERHKHKND